MKKMPMPMHLADEDLDAEAQANVLDEIQALMDKLEGKRLEATVKLSRKPKKGGEEEEEKGEESDEAGDAEKLKAIAK